MRRTYADRKLAEYARMLRFCEQTESDEISTLVGKDFQRIMRRSWKITLIMVAMLVIFMILLWKIPDDTKKKVYHVDTSGIEEWKTKQKVINGRLTFSQFDFEHNYDIDPKDYGVTDFEDGEWLEVIFDYNTKEIVDVIKEDDYASISSISSVLMIVMFVVPVIYVLISVLKSKKEVGLIWGNYTRYIKGWTQDSHFNPRLKYDDTGAPCDKFPLDEYLLKVTKKWW